MSRTGWKKAATLLSVLTGQERDRILGQLDAVTADRLRRETERVGTVPEKIARAIQTEFLFALKTPASGPITQEPITEDSLFDETVADTAIEPIPETEETILPPSAGPSDPNLRVKWVESDTAVKDYRIDTDPQPMPGPHFSLENRLHLDTEEPIDDLSASVSAGAIFAQIASERPQSAAAVLSRMPEAAARLVLAQFDESKRKHIEERLARIGTIEPEAWDIVERTLDSVSYNQQGTDRAEIE